VREPSAAGTERGGTIGTRRRDASRERSGAKGREMPPSAPRLRSCSSLSGRFHWNEARRGGDERGGRGVRVHGCDGSAPARDVTARARGALSSGRLVEGGQQRPSRWGGRADGPGWGGFLQGWGCSGGRRGQRGKHGLALLRVHRPVSVSGERSGFAKLKRPPPTSKETPQTLTRFQKARNVRRQLPQVGDVRLQQSRASSLSRRTDRALLASAAFPAAGARTPQAVGVSPCKTLPRSSRHGRSPALCGADPGEDCRWLESVGGGADTRPLLAAGFSFSSTLNELRKCRRKRTLCLFLFFAPEAKEICSQSAALATETASPF